MHEDVRLAANDPYLVSDDFRREIAGVRYEHAATAVLKLELRSIGRPSADRASELALQLGLAF
jgi:hypothetical protein